MRRFIYSVILLLAVASALSAQEEPHRMWRERPIDQNIIKKWPFTNTLGRATIWDINQDEDGFLWLATNEGVIRFDGIRSTIYDISNTPAFESQDFAQVEVADDGTIWVSGRSGLYYFDGSQFHEWKSSEVQLNSVWKIITRQNGDLLVLADSKLFLINGEQLIEAPYGLEGAFQLKRGFDDRVWVIMRDGTVRYIQDETLYSHDAINEYAKGVAVRMVVDDAEGNLYFSLDNERVVFYDGQEFKEIYSLKGDYDIGLIRNLFPDTHGFVWSTTVTGTYRFNKDKIERLSTDNGLSDNGVRTLFEDRNGDIWIGTFRGLNYIHQSPVGLIQIQEDGKPVPFETKSVVEDERGNIWVGSNDMGLFLYENKQLVKPRASFRVPENIFTIYFFSNGDLLLGGNEGLIRARYKNGLLSFVSKISDEDVRLTYITDNDVIWFNTVGELSGSKTIKLENGVLSEFKELEGKRLRWIYEYESGNLAIGTREGLFRIVDGVFGEIGEDLGFSSDSFSNMWPGLENMWTISEGTSLIRFRENSDTISMHNARNGFTIKSPTGIMMDSNNGVWFSSLSGLYRIALQELDRNTVDEDSLRNVEYYPANVTVNPAGYPINWKAENGVIYYSSPEGLVEVNEEYRDPRVKNYQIQVVDVDGSKVSVSDRIELKPDANKLTIQFSTIDFLDRGDLIFEFKLEGFDEQWYSMNGVRDIYYTSLPPGEYKFRLRETNTDGYYEDSSQSFTIIKPKFWYRTNLAIAVYVILIILLVAWYFKERTKQIRLQNSRLQEQVAARTAKLEEVLSGLEQTVAERTASLSKVNSELSLAMDAGRHAAFKWYFDAEKNKVAEYSDRYFNLLGYEPGEFDTDWKSILKKVHPEDKETFFSLLQQILNSDSTESLPSTFKLEYRIKKKDGDYIWLESTGKLLSNERAITGLVTDISERKWAELEQKASEEKFRKVFDASTNGILLVDKEGKIVMHNKIVQDIFGYQDDEWNGMAVEELIPKDFRKKHVKIRENFASDPEAKMMGIDRDLTGVGKDGKKVPLRIGLSPLSLGSERYVLAIVVDMTERVKMEEDLLASRKQLQQERDRYASVFQNMNDVLFVMDVEEDGRFKFVEVNRMQEEVTGIKSEQTVGKYSYEVFPNLAEYLDWRYSTCRDSKQVVTYMEQLEFKTGLKDFKTSLVPIIEEDRVVRIIGIAHDITDQIASEKIIKDKEEKLRYALQASQDAIIDWNLENGVMEFSDALFRILGYERGEIAEDLESMINITHSADIGDAQKIDMVKIVNNLKEGAQFANSFRMKKKSGEWLWMLLKGKVVERDEKGKAVRFVGTLTNITGEKQKTKERLETILLTEDNERSRISREIHDGLQQTLTITALNLEFAKKEEDKLSERAQKKLATAWEYLQKSIAESRTVAHSLMPKAIVDFGLVSACKSLLMQYDNSIEDVSFRFDENLGDERISDKNVEVTLYRILQEALNNITKYAQATEVTVQLKMYDDVLLMTVEDNGIGFDVEAVREKGIGFGLKSMENRIDAISGHLEIDSNPGKGTVVIVEILKEALE